MVSRPVLTVLAKDVAEDDTITFDFEAGLMEGETIVDTAVSIEVYIGVDPAPSDMRKGLPSIDGSKVSQRFIGGVVGVTYHWRCVADLSTPGRVLTLAAYMPCVRL